MVGDWENTRAELPVIAHRTPRLFDQRLLPYASGLLPSCAASIPDGGTLRFGDRLQMSLCSLVRAQSDFLVLDF